MVNIIHERFPEFGNATCEEELLEEVFRAKVTFLKDIKVISHPKYYKDCLSHRKTPFKMEEDGCVAGVEIHFSNEVDTYVLEFIERG